MIIFTQIKTIFLTSHQNIIAQINKHAIEQKPFLLLVDFDVNQKLFFELDELEQLGIQIQFPTYQNSKNHDVSLQSNINIAITPISLEAYQKKFDYVLQNLKYGNSFLTNLTVATPIQTETSLQTVFHLAQAKYKVLFMNGFVFRLKYLFKFVMEKLGLFQ
jgi:para-aminobenzoate synthetase component I